MKKDLKVRINLEVTPNILDEERTKSQLFSLFENMDDEIWDRIDEIFNYLKTEFYYVHISDFVQSTNIFKAFRANFYQWILNQAVKMAVSSTKKQYNLSVNLTSLLNKDNLADAIYGRIMIDSFIEVISNCESSSSGISHVSELIQALENYLEDESR